MKYWAGLLFLGGFIATPTALAAVLGKAPAIIKTPKEIVRSFLDEVRSGKFPERVSHYLSAEVIAHQMTAEKESSVTRTPYDYAEHTKEFKRIFGEFTFEVTELIAEDDRVYARWKQTGCHIGPIDGYAPSGFPVVEIASAVYRVEDGKIVEYWIQIDRKGIETQIEANSANTDNKVRCLR
jgi:predicted ester cyclase